MITRCSFFVLSLLMASCVKNNKVIDPTKLYSNTYTYTEDESVTSIEVSGRWWESFTSNSVGTWIDQLLENNYDLEIAEAQIEQAKATNQIAWKGRLPNLAYLYGGKTNKKKADDPFLAYSNQSSYKQELLLDYHIDLFGKYKNAEKSSAEMVWVSMYQKEALEHRYIATLLNLAISWDREYSEFEIAKKNLKNAEHRFVLIEDRYQTLEGRGTDLSLIETEISAYEGAILRLNKSMKTIQFAIENLLSLAPDSLQLDYPLMKDQSELSFELLKPLDLIERRPDLRANAHLLKARKLDVAVAFKGFFPDLQVGISGEMIAKSFSDMFKSSSLALYWISSIFQSIFSGGDLSGRWNLASAQEKEVAIAYAKNALVALSEVESALMQIEYLKKMQGKKHQELEKIKEVEKQYFIDYSEGDAPLFYTIEQERIKWRVEQELAYIDSFLFTEKINLCLALGGYWLK